jgi:hypothetical protein
MPKLAAPAAMLFGSPYSKRSAAAIGDIASGKLELGGARLVASNFDRFELTDLVGIPVGVLRKVGA